MRSGSKRRTARCHCLRFGGHDRRQAETGSDALLQQGHACAGTDEYDGIDRNLRTDHHFPRELDRLVDQFTDEKVEVVT